MYTTIKKKTRKNKNKNKKSHWFIRKRCPGLLLVRLQKRRPMIIRRNSLWIQPSPVGRLAVYAGYSRNSHTSVYHITVLNRNMASTNGSVNLMVVIVQSLDRFPPLTRVRPSFLPGKKCELTFPSQRLVIDRRTIPVNT